MEKDVEKQINTLMETLNFLAEKRPQKDIVQILGSTNALLRTLDEESRDDSTWDGNFVYIENRLQNIISGMRRPISTVPGQPRGGQTGGSSGGTGSASKTVTVATINCPNCKTAMTVSHP